MKEEVFKCGATGGSRPPMGGKGGRHEDVTTGCRNWEREKGKGEKVSSPQPPFGTEEIIRMKGGVRESNGRNSGKSLKLVRGKVPERGHKGKKPLWEILRNGW